MYWRTGCTFAGHATAIGFKLASEEYLTQTINGQKYSFKTNPSLEQSIKVERIYGVQLPPEVRAVLRIVRITITLGLEGVPLTCVGADGYVTNALYVDDGRVGYDHDAASVKAGEAIGTLGISKPSVKEMFECVFKEPDWRLIRQRQELGV